ncbi:Phosphoserine transaminase [Xylographa soralifera]|nr:Phosphoserine transaminase [Xylographa soralifera]
MPTREEVAYFGAGPAPLPTPVLEAGSKAFLNYQDTGLSLAEISHRSPLATKIVEDTKAALSSLLEIPDSYEVLFLHGGGSGEFSAVVFNMVAVWVERRRRRAEKELGSDEAKVLERVRREVREELRLDYLVTGSWSLKASQEAANLLEPLGKGFVNVAMDAREASGGKFGTVPEESSWKLTPTRKEGGKGSAFVYYCDNETVDGVEFPSFPSVLQPTGQDEEDEHLVVADMSSNFLSRHVDVHKYAVIFGGAQKNIGITDTTIVIIRKSLLATYPTPSFLHAVGVWSPPVIFHYPTIAKNNSLYNTIPIFSIWIAGEVMRSLLTVHGTQATYSQENLAGEKAKVVYDILDGNPDVFQVCPDRKARSRMNICFRIYSGDKEKEKAFLEGAEKRGLQGLKGHRSVGGVRVSNYNAVPMANVKKLALWLVDFAQPPMT